VGELFEARRLLEPAIAAIAARRATREEISEMERIVEDQAKEVAAGRTGMLQDTALHAAIANSAHNRAITRIVNALMDLLTQSRGVPAHARETGASHQDHRRILAAVQKRDEVAAHRAMLDHLIAVETLVTGAHAEERPSSGSAGGRRKPRSGFAVTRGPVRKHISQISVRT
jgi:GntR family transcriptional repressor for pyruvate dehydrogenase complex